MKFYDESIVAIGTLTADAQYFKGQGRVYARKDIARDYLLSKYIETKWLYAAPMSETNIESPIVTKNLQGYQYSSQRQSGAIPHRQLIKLISQRERPWLGMYLRPLLEFAYSLYEPQYMPNGN